VAVVGDRPVPAAPDVPRGADLRRLVTVGPRAERRATHAIQLQDPLADHARHEHVAEHAPHVVEGETELLVTGLRGDGHGSDASAALGRGPCRAARNAASRSSRRRRAALAQRARQSANDSPSVHTPRAARSDTQIVAVAIARGAETTATPSAMTARTIVAMPSERGRMPVSAQIFPIVHHHMPCTKSAGTARSAFAEAAMPTVTVARPAAVPRMLPLSRTGR